MIYDSMDHIGNYKEIAVLKNAIEYAETHDLSAMPVGVYELDGKNLILQVQEYTTKNPEDCRVESHKAYIDLQIMLHGNENIGYRRLAECGEPVESNPDGDIWFYGADAQDFAMTDGQFMVLFPHDGHRPCARRGENQTVNKAVFKIHI